MCICQTHFFNTKKYMDLHLPKGTLSEGTCERDWREHEEFFSRKISVP